MKLKRFTSLGLDQVALISLLFFTLSLATVQAVELVGSPAVVGSHASTSQSVLNISSEPDKISSEPDKIPGKSDDAKSTTSGGSSATAQDSMSAESDSDYDQESHDRESHDHESHNQGFHNQKSHDDFEQAMNHLGPALESAFGHDPENIVGAALLIPILAILLIFGGPVILIIVLVWMHYRAKARRAQNINANIERLIAAGRDIPIELLRGDEALTAAESSMIRDDLNLHKGMKNIGLGVGWLLFLTILCGIKVGAFAFIFIGLGISQLVVWKLAGVKVNATQAQD